MGQSVAGYVLCRAECENLSRVVSDSRQWVASHAVTHWMSWGRVLQATCCAVRSVRTWAELWVIHSNEYVNSLISAVFFMRCLYGNQQLLMMSVSRNKM